MANYGSNFVAGAGTGAAAGSVAGPYGAIIGGAVGGIVGLISAYEDEQDEKRKQQILERIKREYNLSNAELQATLKAYYNNPDNFMGKASDVQAYRDTIANYDPTAFVANYNEFEYDKNVDDFVNPYFDKIIDSVGKKVQQSAAGAGVGRGTGAAQAIAAAQAEKEDALYQTALNQYNTDRAQKYQEWSGNITALQNKLNALKGATDTKVNMMGNLAQDYSDTRKQYMSDYLAMKQNQANGNLSLASMSLNI